MISRFDIALNQCDRKKKKKTNATNNWTRSYEEVRRTLDEEDQYGERIDLACSE